MGLDDEGRVGRDTSSWVGARGKDTRRAATREDGGMDHRNLMPGPPPVYLPDDPCAAELAGGADPATVAAGDPACLEQGQSHLRPGGGLMIVPTSIAAMSGVAAAGHGVQLQPAADCRVLRPGRRCSNR